MNLSTELTVEQRLSLYLILLVESDTLHYDEEICRDHSFENDERSGLCKLIRAVTGMIYYDLSVNDLPEIRKRKPATHGVYWFPNDDLGWVERRRILEESIIECETELFNHANGVCADPMLNY